MQSRILDYLVCPNCQSSLECKTESTSKNGIETGTLFCTECNFKYPIVRGIPRFITLGNDHKGYNIETTNAFGWEWQKFRELHDIAIYKTQFLDWIDPIQPDFFKGKVVLDAGCGMGRFSRVSSQLGAELVLAVDASDSVEAARENTFNDPAIEVIQADIHHLPFRCGDQSQVDFIFSIGVLHHLDKPQQGFYDLTDHLKRDGTIFVWVYGRENNGWIIYFLDPIRNTITSRLPRNVLYITSGVITVILQTALKLIYLPVNRFQSMKWLAKFLPYNDYLAWLSQFSFHHNHHVVFDHLVAPVAFYIRKEELLAWFKKKHMQIISLSWRNKNSWRAHVKRTAS